MAEGADFSASTSTTYRHGHRSSLTTRQTGCDVDDEGLTPHLAEVGAARRPRAASTCRASRILYLLAKSRIFSCPRTETFSAASALTMTSTSSRPSVRRSSNTLRARS